MNKDINDKNFEAEVINSSMPVLVDFWAPWCGPCRIQGQIVEELANEYKDKKIVITKVNVDENPEISQNFSIMSIPTLMFFNGGKAVNTLIGLRSKEELKKEIDDILA